MDHAVPEVLIHFNISCSSDVLAKKKEIVWFFLLSIFLYEDTVKFKVSNVFTTVWSFI